MENGHIAAITSAALGHGTITPSAGAGPVRFRIEVVHGDWALLFQDAPVRFIRSADPLVASYVEPV